MSEDRSATLDCRQLVELVSDFLDGTLDGPQRAAFQAHLEGCDDCERYVEQMRETIRIVGRVSPETIRPSERDELLRRFRALLK